jgi:hypothetical protein
MCRPLRDLGFGSREGLQFGAPSAFAGPSAVALRAMAGQDGGQDGAGIMAEFRVFRVVRG